jgi:protein transport protein SEC61 subunit gamma-like protein
MEEEFRQTRMQKFKQFLNECGRVLRVTKKPDSQEFKTTVKVTALGIAVIGLIGFVITIAKQLIFG